MIKFLATIAVVSVCNYSYAQKFPDSLSATTTFLRFTPVGLADLNDLNLSFGLEKRISNKSSFALDASFIFYSQAFSDISNRSRGFVLRPAYRFYPLKNNFAIEAQLHYKQVTHRLTDWVGRDVVDGVSSYEEYMTFRLRKSVVGFHVNAVRQYYLSKRFWVELYLGIGVHFRKYRIVDDPDVTYIVNDTFNPISTRETDALPALPAGARILYRLSK